MGLCIAYYDLQCDSIYHNFDFISHVMALYSISHHDVASHVTLPLTNYIFCLETGFISKH